MFWYLNTVLVLFFVRFLWRNQTKYVDLFWPTRVLKRVSLFRKIAYPPTFTVKGNN